MANVASRWASHVHDHLVTMTHQEIAVEKTRGRPKGTGAQKVYDGLRDDILHLRLSPGGVPLAIVATMDAISFPPAPTNEPNLTYAPGTPERESLLTEIAALEAVSRDLPAYVGGEWRAGGGEEIRVVQPHDHQHVLGVTRNATTGDAQAAVDAAIEAAPAWRAMPFDERCAILLKAADLLAGPWRQKLNAATVLGQSKTAFQAEIDAACELIDFWRFNVHYAKQILTDQPIANSPGIWNRTDHRPLEGFVYAITPFNFTAIAGNLPTAPALMGNTVVWKPSPTQQLAASLTMELLIEAGMPPGVINMVPGDGLAVSEVALPHRDLAGIHFTGSTPTFQHLWRSVGENITGYRSYPRIVGETGGKDFIVAHPSADPAVLTTAMIRGAFEFQGQKCSACSRVIVLDAVYDRFVERLTEAGVPVVQPAGGHAVFLDAGRFLNHLDWSEYPGQALAMELYLEGGIRACEIGSVMLARKDAQTGHELPANHELVRLAIPRRTYTQSHMDFVIEIVRRVHERRAEIHGVRIVDAPPVLRHFQAKFAQMS